MKIKLALVDDNPFMRAAVQEKTTLFEDLNLKIIAQSGHDLLQQLSKDHNLDIILMDIEMPGMDGIEATREVSQKYPHIKIIMLTVFDSDEYIFKAIQAGANGYLLKDTPPAALHQGLRETLDEGATMTPSIALKALRLLRTPFEAVPEEEQEEFKLTKREIDVLEQLGKGLSYKAIAENLIVSIGTVRKHIERIYRKLQVHNKLEAVEKAKRNRLI